MTALRGLLAAPGLLTVPGIFDGVSARLAAAAGFPALYMTGYGTAASAYGLPDTGLATYTEMVDRVRLLAELVPVPLIADGDTGYGAPSNLRRTVRGYERAGAAAIQIEDQRFPKVSGHAARPAPVVDRDEAVLRIRTAVGARRTDAFLVVARTDARRLHGLDEALRRASLFREAGADMLFVEGPETPEEMRRIAETFRGVPLVANMARGGRSPSLGSADLEAMGYTVALAPVDALLAAAHAMRAVYAGLRRHGVDAATLPPMASLAELGTLMGVDEIRHFDTARTEDIR